MADGVGSSGKGGSFVGAFIPGLVIGLIVGGFAGAVLVPVIFDGAPQAANASQRPAGQAAQARDPRPGTTAQPETDPAPAAPAPDAGSPAPTEPAPTEPTPTEPKPSETKPTEPAPAPAPGR